MRSVFVKWTPVTNEVEGLTGENFLDIGHTQLDYFPGSHGSCSYDIAPDTLQPTALGKLTMMLQPGARPVPKSPDYVLIRKLGAGAFGEVWHAHGPGGLDVALKFIRLDPHLRNIELRSLEVMKSIRHPNLVSLFGAWHKDNCLILAMELCDRSLQDRLNEALHENLAGVPNDELLKYMMDAANGLDALNAKQVQHRDVKPGNLLLLASGVKVADFGLAKALEQTVASNSGAGTVAYLAPECFKGELRQQTDQYSLAVTYYHLCTGELLFKGDQAQMMYAHLELQPNLEKFFPYARGVLARALSKEPGKRWPSCRAFVSELVRAHEAVLSPAFIAALVKGMRKEYDEAIMNWNEVIRLYPFPPFCSLNLCNRGENWLAKNEYDKAIEDFDKAIRLDPNSAVAYHDCGLAWSAKKDFDIAIKNFNEAIRLNPSDAGFYHERGIAFSNKKDHAKAISDFSEAIRLDPDFAMAYNSRGLSLREQNKFDKAINDFDEAIRIDPKFGYAYKSRGFAWIEKKEYDRAIADFNEGIRLGPEEGHAYFNRGIAWWNKRDWDNATLDFYKAANLDPDLSEEAWEFYLSWLFYHCSKGTLFECMPDIRKATEACEATGWKSRRELADLAETYRAYGLFDAADEYEKMALDLILPRTD